MGRRRIGCLRRRQRWGSKVKKVERREGKGNRQFYFFYNNSAVIEGGGWKKEQGARHWDSRCFSAIFRLCVYVCAHKQKDLSKVVAEEPKRSKRKEKDLNKK